MSNRIAAFDIDGVLYDTSAHMSRCYKAQFKKDLVWQCYHHKKLGLPKEHEDWISAKFGDENFFRELRPEPKMRKLVRELMANGFEVRVVTSRPIDRKIFLMTICKLKADFGVLPAFCGNSKVEYVHEMQPAVYVDDDPEVYERAQYIPGTKVMLMKRCYNSAYNATDMDVIISSIREMAIK